MPFHLLPMTTPSLPARRSEDHSFRMEYDILRVPRGDHFSASAPDFRPGGSRFDPRGERHVLAIPYQAN